MCTDFGGMWSLQHSVNQLRPKPLHFYTKPEARLDVNILLCMQAPYFYEVGNKLNEMWERSPIFSDFLVKTFRTRYYELISKVRRA